MLCVCQEAVHRARSHCRSMLQTRSCFCPTICLCAAALLFELLRLPSVLVATTSKPHAKYCAAVQVASPFEAWGCAPENGHAAAPEVGRSVSLTASQFRREDFFRGGRTKMLRLVNGVVSIRSAHECGPPRRINCGFTSHARTRHVLLTCMKRPHESKLSCNLWIAGRERVSAL